MRGMELRLLTASGSPNGRYAIAWGIPGVSRLDQFTLRTLPEDKIRNYVVEKRSLRMVGVLPLHRRFCPSGTEFHWLGTDGRPTDCPYKQGGNLWQFAGTKPSNHEVRTQWDQAEEWGVVYYEAKWWYDALYLCHRAGSTFTVAEIGNTVEDFVRGYVRKRHPAVYADKHRRDPRGPAVFVDHIELHPPYVTVRVCAYVVKQDTPLDTYGYLRLRIEPRAGGFRAVPVDFRLLPLKVMREHYSINQ